MDFLHIYPNGTVPESCCKENAKVEERCEEARTNPSSQYRDELYQTVSGTCTLIVYVYSGTSLLRFKFVLYLEIIWSVQRFHCIRYKLKFIVICVSLTIFPPLSRAVWIV